MRRGKRTEEVTRAADELHGEALSAIYGRRLNQYKSILDAYSEMLLEFATSWQRYDVKLTTDFLQDFELLGLSPYQQILQHLYEELREAINTDSREVAREALGLAFTVASRSTELGAHALWVAMLNHLGHAYGFALQTSDPEVGRMIRDLAPRWLWELGHYFAARVLESEEEPQDARREAAVFVREVFEAANELLKEMIEAADLESLKAADDRWSQLLELWHPEDARLRRYEAEPSVESSDDATTQPGGHRKPTDFDQEMAKTKQDLASRRRAYRYGLTFWAFRVRESIPNRWSRGFLYLASAHFSSAKAAADGADAALRLFWESGDAPWSRWTLSELPEGRVHTLGIDRDLLQTFLVLALLATEIDYRELLPFEWIGSRGEQLVQMLDELPERPLTELIGAAEIADRKSSLRAVLERAAHERRETESRDLRGAAIDPAKVSEFTEGVRASWASGRFAPSLFERFGRYEEGGRDPKPDEGWFGLDRLLPKGLFLQESGLVGGDSSGAEFGRGMARGEMGRLIEALSRSDSLPVEATPESTFRSLVRESLEFLAPDYRPQVVLVPVNWKLRVDWEPNPFAPRPIPPSDWRIPEEAGHSYLGSVDDALVFEWPGVPDDRLYVVDLGSFAIWRQWPASPNGDQLLVEVSAYTPETALELAEKSPDIFGDLGTEQRLNRILEHVLLHIRTRFAVEIADAAAGRYVLIPPKYLERA
jgi:hypothetical protein